MKLSNYLIFYKNGFREIRQIQNNKPDSGKEKA